MAIVKARLPLQSLYIKKDVLPVIRGQKRFKGKSGFTTPRLLRTPSISLILPRPNSCLTKFMGELALPVMSEGKISCNFVEKY